MPKSKLSISMRPELAAALDQRGDERSAVLGRMLERHLALIDRERRALAEILSDGEIGLILDALNGIAFADTFSIAFVHAEIADSLPDGLAEKWHVDGPALVEKLRDLTYAQNLALVDCVERWWNRVARGERDLKPAAALKPKKDEG